jgi:hypothetical protein
MMSLQDRYNDVRNTLSGERSIDMLFHLCASADMMPLLALRIVFGVLMTKKRPRLALPAVRGPISAFLCRSLSPTPWVAPISFYL